MERPIHILFSGPRERYGELLARLQQRYAVHQAHDIWAAVEYADQARTAGRPYELALIAYDLPLFGEAAAFAQLRVIAPTTPLLALVPPDMVTRPDLPVEPEHLLVEPVETEVALARVGDLLEERAAHVARLRSEVVAPLAALNDEVLRQPDLLSALRVLYRHLAGLMLADTYQVALYDHRRALMLVPLAWEMGVLRSGRPRRHQPSAGLADWVIAHDTPLVTGDLRADAARRGWPAGEPGSAQVITSALVLPLRLGGEVIGIIGVYSSAPNAFAQTAYQILSFVADFVAGVVGHWWGRRRWEREHEVLAALDQQLLEAPDREAVLLQTAQAALQVTGMAAATVIGLDATGAPAEQVVVPSDTTFATFTPALATLAHHLATARQTGEVDYTLTTRTLTELGQRGVGRVISYALTNDGQADALLWLLHGSERPFDAEDQAALGAVARQGRLALAAQAGEQARQQEQQGLARLAWRASVENSRTLLLSTAFNEMRKLVPWRGAALWQADPVLGLLSVLRVEGTLTVLPTQPLPLTEALLAPVLARGGVHRIAADPLAAPGAVAGGLALAVSLRRSEAQGAGVLVVERAPGAPDFSPREESLLLSLVQLLVAGLERLRWQNLGALHRALIGALEYPPPALWEQAVGVVATHLGEDTTAALLLAGAEWIPLAVVAPEGDVAPPPWTVAAPLLRAALTPGAVARVYTGPEVAPLGSLAVAPLNAGGGVSGLLVVWTARSPAFGSAELELLEQAANRLAPLVVLAQAGPGPASRSRALTLLQTLHRDALATPDVGGLLRLVLMHALANTPATYGALFLREAGDVVHLRAEYPTQAENVPAEIVALAAQVSRTGQWSQQMTADRKATLVCVPLREGRLSIGALLAVSLQAGAFAPDDLDLLTQLARLAADLISSRQQSEAERALRSVAGLPVPTGQVLARLPALVCQALHVPVCLVHVLDRRRNAYVLAGGAGVRGANPAALAALALPADDPALLGFFERGGAVAADAANATPWSPARLRAAGLISGAARPILVDGRLWGILSVHTPDDRPLDPGVPRAVAALASELGPALEGLQREQRLGLLSAGSQLLSYLPVGLEDAPLPAWDAAPFPLLLAHIVQQIAALTESGGVYLLLRRAEGGVALAAAAGAGAPAPLPPGVAALLDLTEPRYLADKELLTASAPVALDATTRSSLALPLVLRDAAQMAVPALGVLLLESPTPQAFSPDDIRVLEAQAALITSLLFQHGLAAQLLAQDQQAQTLLSEVPRLLSETDEARLQHQLVILGAETLGADLVVLFPAGIHPPEVPPQSGNQQPGAIAGSPPVQAMIRQVLNAASRHPAPYLVPDVTRFPAGDPSGWLGGEGIRALALVPLLVDGVVLGALFAGWRRVMTFDPARRQAVQLMAGLAGSVLAASREQTRTAAALQNQMQSLSMAAHELREPLDKVHMIIETALNGLWLPMSEELRGRLGIAYTLLDQQYELLNRVLQLDQLRTGQRSLERQPVGLAGLVQQVVSRYADLAQQGGVQLGLAVDPLLAPQQALLDPVLLGLALGNLVQNAVKFTPPGSRVALGVTLSYTARGRDLVFTVDDTGIGIPGDQLEAIFVPYYQIDRSLGRQAGGLGLGLPIARLAAELHGGTLAVTSRLGQGSQFTLRIPFLPAPS